MQNKNLESTVREIIENVKNNGDESLIYYSEKFDNTILTKDKLLLDVKYFESELNNIKPEVLEALKKAAENIQKYHEKQFDNINRNSFKFSQNNCDIHEKISSIDRVGIYVPGGRYSYPSTVLMTVIPAKCAGVSEILVSSPLKNLTPLVKVALYLAGADKVLCVGGAQAIAAMAYGTELVEKVDIIVGPGNAFVTEAKRQVFGYVGIDSLAGPSDVLIYADDTVDIKWVLKDMMAQAEHDNLASSVLVSENENFVREIENIINKDKLSVLYGRCRCHYLQNISDCVNFINKIAPEHLEIMTQNETKINGLLSKIKHAGAIFVGKYTTVAMGDYFIGPSHTLPTNSNARFSSGLSVNTFLKRSAVMTVNEKFVLENAEFIRTIADEEGLKFHAESIKIREKTI